MEKSKNLKPLVPENSENDAGQKEKTQPIREDSPPSKRELRLVREEGVFIPGHVVFKAGKNFYMAPDSMGGKKEISVDPDDNKLILLYNWEDEINDALPDIDTIRTNLRNALWRNGATTKEAAKESKVRRNLTKGAFPYRIEI